MHKSDDVVPKALRDLPSVVAIKAAEEADCTYTCTWEDCTEIAVKVCTVCGDDGFCKRCYNRNRTVILQFYRYLTYCDLCKNAHHHKCGQTVTTNENCRSRCNVCISSERKRVDPQFALKKAPWSSNVGEDEILNNDLQPRAFHDEAAAGRKQDRNYDPDTRFGQHIS